MAKSTKPKPIQQDSHVSKYNKERLATARLRRAIAGLPELTDEQLKLLLEPKE